MADVEYLFATAQGTYVSGELVDGVWVLAVVVMAMAPGWPSRPAGVSLPTWALLLMPVASTAAALLLLVLGQGTALHPSTVTLAAATIVVALVRLAVTFREVVSLAESRQLALTDELTGLGNRRALYDDVPKRLASLQPSDPVALLLLDLDRFKDINDSLGHHAGDEMLADRRPPAAGGSSRHRRTWWCASGVTSSRSWSRRRRRNSPPRSPNRSVARSPSPCRSTA